MANCGVVETESVTGIGATVWPDPYEMLIVPAQLPAVIPVVITVTFTIAGVVLERAEALSQFAPQFVVEVARVKPAWIPVDEETWMVCDAGGFWPIW
jgi:hypothetical protein